MFVEDGAGHWTHAMADQVSFETYLLQCYVGGLAVAVGARAPACWEHVFTMSTIGFDLFQKREGDDMRALLLHAFCRNLPKSSSRC